MNCVSMDLLFCVDIYGLGVCWLSGAHCWKAFDISTHITVCFLIYSHGLFVALYNMSYQRPHANKKVSCWGIHGTELPTCLVMHWHWSNLMVNLMPIKLQSNLKCYGDNWPVPNYNKTQQSPIVEKTGSTVHGAEHQYFILQSMTIIWVGVRVVTLMNRPWFSGHWIYQRPQINPHTSVYAKRNHTYDSTRNYWSTNV